MSFEEKRENMIKLVNRYHRIVDDFGGSPIWTELLREMIERLKCSIRDAEDTELGSILISMAERCLREQKITDGIRLYWISSMLHHIMLEHKLIMEEDFHDEGKYVPVGKR